MIMTNNETHKKLTEIITQLFDRDALTEDPEWLAYKMISYGVKLEEIKRKEEQNELSPCPFCGSDAQIIHDSNNGLCYARCTSCTTMQCGWHTKETAIEKWNRRVCDTR